MMRSEGIPHEQFWIWQKNHSTLFQQKEVFEGRIIGAARKAGRNGWIFRRIFFCRCFTCQEKLRPVIHVDREDTVNMVTRHEPMFSAIQILLFLRRNWVLRPIHDCTEKMSHPSTSWSDVKIDRKQWQILPESWKIWVSHSFQVIL